MLSAADGARTLRREPKNHKGRWSASISINHAERLILAAAFAERTGRRLNRFVTVNFDQGELYGRSQDCLGAFLKLSNDWLRMSGAGSAYVWVMENGQGQGSHVHLLMHLPRHLAAGYADRQRGWLSKAGLAACKARVIKSEWVPSAAAVKGVLKYMIKGASPELIALFQNQLRGADGGIVFGKRCGTSQSLGQAARARARSRAGRIAS